MITDKILEYLNKEPRANGTGSVGGVADSILGAVSQLSANAFAKQFIETPDPPRLRVSMAGHCFKKLWYIHQGTEAKGKKIDARAKLNFFYGDLIELAVVNLAVLAGCDLRNYGKDQLTVKVLALGQVFEGHPDGVLYEGDDKYLFECKSMNDFQFKEFEKGKVSKEYLVQINMYMKSLGLEKCVFVAFNKQSGVIAEQIIGYNFQLSTRGLTNLVTAQIDKEPAPPKDLAPDDKGFYPWNCLYCAYHEVCRKDAEKVVVGNRYKLRRKPHAEEKEKNKEATVS